MTRVLPSDVHSEELGFEGVITTGDTEWALCHSLQRTWDHESIAGRMRSHYGIAHWTDTNRAVGLAEGLLVRSNDDVSPKLFGSAQTAAKYCSTRLPSTK